MGPNDLRRNLKKVTATYKSFLLPAHLHLHIFPVEKPELKGNATVPKPQSWGWGWGRPDKTQVSG